MQLQLKRAICLTSALRSFLGRYRVVAHSLVNAKAPLPVFADIHDGAIASLNQPSRRIPQDEMRIRVVAANA